MAIRSGSASWVDTADCYAPLRLMRRFVEERMAVPVKGLPKI